MLSVNQGGIKYHFWVFGMTQPGIEPGTPGPLANTLLIRPYNRVQKLQKQNKKCKYERIMNAIP